MRERDGQMDTRRILTSPKCCKHGKRKLIGATPSIHSIITVMMDYSTSRTGMEIISYVFLNPYMLKL